MNTVLLVNHCIEVAGVDREFHEFGSGINLSIGVARVHFDWESDYTGLAPNTFALQLRNFTLIIN